MAYIIVIALFRLESGHVIVIGIVDSNSVAMGKGSVARTVVRIFTALVNVRVGIAV